MNSNMVKPEKFAHLHLVYHFTVLLSKIPSNKIHNSEIENETRRKETNNFSCWFFKAKTKKCMGLTEALKDLHCFFVKLLSPSQGL